MNTKIITNENKPNKEKIKRATEIISQLQNELPKYIKRGFGPFLAAVYCGDKLIAKCANTVVADKCSNHHAEVNVIRTAQHKLKTYDLSDKNLALYVTSEPCMMCIGAIMWSGIKNIYYGVSSKKVEKITGFDEGFKPNWFNEFKKRGIKVYGNIETELGEDVLKQYIESKHIVYKPSR